MSECGTHSFIPNSLFVCLWQLSFVVCRYPSFWLKPGPTKRQDRSWSNPNCLTLMFFLKDILKMLIFFLEFWEINQQFTKKNLENYLWQTEWLLRLLLIWIFSMIHFISNAFSMFLEEIKRYRYSTMLCFCVKWWTCKFVKANHSHEIHKTESILSIHILSYISHNSFI